MTKRKYTMMLLSPTLRYLIALFFTLVFVVATSFYFLQPQSWPSSLNGSPSKWNPTSGFKKLATDTTSNTVSATTSATTESSTTTISLPDKNVYAILLMRDDPLYFRATRTLLFQLRHDPATRDPLSRPVLLIATSEVSQSALDQLAYEGATIRVVENITSIKGVGEDNRWRGLYTKLRIWELEEYDRVLLLDADQMLVQPIHEIWDDPASVNLTAGGLAAVSDNRGANHKIPSSTHGYLNGGLLLARPSKVRFGQLLAIDASNFDTGLMEQALLNYAYRWDGPMAWSPLDHKWSANWPTLKDLREGGSHMLHDKFWSEGNKDWVDRELVEMWWRACGRMEGFWIGREGLGED